MSKPHYILDASGEPTPEPDIVRWAEWMRRADGACPIVPTRSVARTHIADSTDSHGRPHRGVGISTVFLGIDHNFFDGPPTLYQTMIFGGEHDGHQERTATRLEALAAHEEAVAMVRGE